MRARTHRRPQAKVAASRRRPGGWISACALVTALAGLRGGLAQAPAPEGGPPPGQGAARRNPAPIRYAVDGGVWAWLQEAGEGGQIRLMTGGPGAQPREVARGEGWIDVALRDGAALVLTRRGDLGRIERVALKDGTSAVLRDRVPSPGDLHAWNGKAAWLTWKEPVLPDMPFILPASGRLLLSIENDGAVREVAIPGALAPQVGDVVGEIGKELIVQVRRLRGTEFLAVDPDLRTYRRLAAEGEDQIAAIHAGRLLWTAPSQEANEASNLRCIKRLRDGSEEVIVDWLLPWGSLLSTRRGACYAYDRVYWLPERPGRAVRGAETGFFPTGTDGDRILALDPVQGVRLLGDGSGR